MMDFLEHFRMTAGRFQPDSAHTYHHDRQYLLSQKCLALLVGIVALGLPFVMLIGSWTSLLGIVPEACSYNSISHFYYAQFLGDVLVASLAFIGAFLLAYRGENFYENIFATLAGFAAFGVALFPTSGPGCKDTPFSGRVLAVIKEKSESDPTKIVDNEKADQLFQLFANVEIYHFACAAVLFLFLAFYTIFVFTRVIDSQHFVDGELTPAKAARNGIYYASGFVILLSILAMIIKAFVGEWDLWTDNDLTFWFESLALWAFGFSWMVKGRFLKPIGWLLDPRD